jgi:hypothetical protein
MKSQKLTTLISRPVKKRTRFFYSIIGVGVFSLSVYGKHIKIPNIYMSNIDIKILAKQVLNDQTFPSPSDKKARCPLIRQKPWYQRWGPCWE